MTLLYYTILYYTILYYNITIIYYTIRYDTILYYTILYYTILYYTKDSSVLGGSTSEEDLEEEGRPRAGSDLPDLPEVLY